MGGNVQVFDRLTLVVEVVSSTLVESLAVLQCNSVDAWTLLSHQSKGLVDFDVGMQSSFCGKQLRTCCCVAFFKQIQMPS